MKKNKIILIDDIHLEGREKEDFSSFFSTIQEQIVEIRNNDYHPIVVCAGDIAEGTDGVEWASKFDTDVIYVCGNHEFWNGDYYETIKNIKNFIEENKYSNIHFLHNETKVINDTKFIGTTLWTDLGSTLPWLTKNYVIRYYVTMGDFRKITAKDWYTTENIKLLEKILSQNGVENSRINDLIENKSFNPLIQLEENKIATDFIEKELNIDFNGETIVVTHHLPSSNIWLKVKNVDSKFITGEEINNERSFYDGIRGNNRDFKEVLMSGFYSNNLNDLILTTQPSYWLHGHLHSPVNEVIGHTKIISSPAGYKKQSNEIKFKIFDVNNSKDFIKNYLLDEIKDFNWNEYLNNLKELENIILNFQTSTISGLIFANDFTPILNKYKKDHILNINKIDCVLTKWLSILLKEEKVLNLPTDSYLLKKQSGLLDFKSEKIKKEVDKRFKKLELITANINKNSFLNETKYKDINVEKDINCHYLEWLKELTTLQIQFSQYKQILLEFIESK